MLEGCTEGAGCGAQSASIVIGLNEGDPTAEWRDCVAVGREVMNDVAKGDIGRLF